MATIMSQSFGKGGLGSNRRCDATCHKARKPECGCICGGKYHGKGSSDAAQEALTEDFFGKDWREQKAAVEARGESWVKVVTDALQTKLPGVIVTPTKAVGR